MKQFVKISKQFGFNRNRLLCWEFFQHERQGETVVLTFENGAVILEGPDVQTFRNWTENEAEPAPETYQHTLFEPMRVAEDLKQNSTPQRGN